MQPTSWTAEFIWDFSYIRACYFQMYSGGKPEEIQAGNTTDHVLVVDAVSIQLENPQN